MSFDNDHDLLEEIKNERKTDSTKASLISLFEGDKNAIFTPSTAMGVIASILTGVILLTLWYSSVNARLDQLSNNQVELFSAHSRLKTDFDSLLISVSESIRALESDVSRIENRYDTDKLISESVHQQTMNNLVVQLNELNRDVNDLFKHRTEYELARRDVQHSLEKLDDRIKRLEGSSQR